MTGNALRIWPTGCRPTGCTWCLTAAPVLGPAKGRTRGPRSAARCSTSSGSPTTEPDAGRVRNRPRPSPGQALVFRSVGTLSPLYQHLARESVLSVKAEQIASFLGRQISPQLAQEIGSQFSTRIEGTCIKHRFASSSIKMDDKYGCGLRIETTINDVSFFKHHRKSL